jgi:DNA-binding beta-propeller fold protein YncE
MSSRAALAAPFVNSRAALAAPFVNSRAALAAPLVIAACGTRRTAGFRGYAFIANEEGHAVAAVDLEALAVARLIPLDGAPSEIAAARVRPLVYALTPSSGSIHEIQADRLSFTRKLAVAASALTMRLTPPESAIFILTKEPRALVRVALDSFKVDWRVALPDEPKEFALSPDGKTAAITLGSEVRLLDLATRRFSAPLGHGDFGAVRFLADSRTMIAANRSDRLLSLYDVPAARLIANLPLAVRPDNLCFKQTDDGQLFITGEGMDAVVVVFPYHTPEVFETVLGGHGLGAMAASESFLFITSPQSGNVSILDINSRKLAAVVSVGSDPGFVAVTPDDQYALVLNRKSGDVAVLRIGTIQPNRYKSAALLTVIPVGSRPVSAAIRPL